VILRSKKCEKKRYLHRTNGVAILAKLEDEKRRRSREYLDTVDLDRVDEPVRLVTVSIFFLNNTRGGRLTSPKAWGWFAT